MTPALADAFALRQQRYEDLVRPHLDRLLGFAARRTVSFSDAEDAVQDMCVRAWSAFDELRDPARVRPWLFSILRTVLSDAFDRTGRRARLVPMSRLEDVHEQFVSTDSDVVFAEVVARLDEEMLRMALDAIPEDFASAVELHDIEGFKYHEIADIVGVPIGTVMSRISRGRRLLAGVIMERRQQWALGSADAGRRNELRSELRRGHGRTPRTS
jgi:RNA polymerase sigma-70 factor (ECF subfamily)